MAAQAGVPSHALSAPLLGGECQRRPADSGALGSVVLGERPVGVQCGPAVPCQEAPGAPPCTCPAVHRCIRVGPGPGAGSAQGRCFKTKLFKGGQEAGAGPDGTLAACWGVL